MKPPATADEIRALMPQPDMVTIPRKLAEELVKCRDEYDAACGALNRAIEHNRLLVVEGTILAAVREALKGVDHVNEL